MRCRNHLYRQHFHHAYLVGLCLTLSISGFTAEQHIQLEGILGTSLDCTVIAPTENDCQSALNAITTRFDQLDDIFSTWRDDTALSKLNKDERTKIPIEELPNELNYLLKQALKYHKDSRGVFDPCYAAPNRRGVPYRMTTRILGRSHPINLDAVAKGYIMDQALAAALATTPHLSGLLINCGGDVRIFGKPATGDQWHVAITDPDNPADNASPLATVGLNNGAIATSGNYHRPGHLTNPKTGESVNHVLSATVIAPDAEQADAWATICAIGDPSANLRFIDRRRDMACLIITSDGQQQVSKHWDNLGGSALTTTLPQTPDQLTQGDAWQSTHRVNLLFTLTNSTPGKKFHRHYMVAWVTDAQDQYVGLIELWAEKGKHMKYVRDLTEYYREYHTDIHGKNLTPLEPRTQATRRLGDYELTWDGTNDKDEAVPAGNYIIHIEVNREKGPPDGKERATHVQIPITLGGTTNQHIRAPDEPELTNISVQYARHR